MSKAWEGTIRIPVEGRTIKPRKTGVTMVIDQAKNPARFQEG